MDKISDDELDFNVFRVDRNIASSDCSGVLEITVRKQLFSHIVKVTANVEQLFVEVGRGGTLLLTWLIFLLHLILQFMTHTK